MNLTKHYEKTKWGNRIMFSNEDSTIRFALYTYNDDPKTLYFSNLFVDDNIRGNGLGDEILNYVFDYAKSKSYDSIILNVVKDSWVRKWYERKGFHYLEDCDGEYEGNVWMIKNIKRNTMIKTFEEFNNKVERPDENSELNKKAIEYADSIVEHKFDETEWLQIYDAYVAGYMDRDNEKR